MTKNLNLGNFFDDFEFKYLQVGRFSEKKKKKKSFIKIECHI